MKRKILVCSLMVVLLVGFGVATVPEATREATAQFVLSVANDPDQYGQGMGDFAIFENITGSWEWYDAPFHIWYSAPHTFEWNVSGFIKIRCENYLNATVTGATDLADGKNYLRNNITVLNTNGSTVFSQNNFTYLSSAEVSGLYYYTYEVILNFSPTLGEIYQATISYEVYY